MVEVLDHVLSFHWDHEEDGLVVSLIEEEEEIVLTKEESLQVAELILKNAGVYN